MEVRSPRPLSKEMCSRRYDEMIGGTEIMNLSSGAIEVSGLK